MSQPESIVSSFSEISDLYLTQQRQTGQVPDIEDIVARFPHMEEEVRSRLPMMFLLERTQAGNDTLATASAIEGCVVEGTLGRGAMGVVYHGYQSAFDRRVAIKVIKFAGRSESSVERFALERKAMARLEHPNIVPAYSYVHDQEVGCLIMKLIEGFSLDQLLKGDCDYTGQSQLIILQSDWNEFALLARAIVSGLRHAHDNGLVHRDIKPSNILIDAKRNPWITDFGLAKLMDSECSLSASGDVIGTPRYMAPEQMVGHCDQRSDLYSLGLTLYELASGQKARESGDSAVRRGSGASTPTLVDVREKNPDVPVALAKIIMKACSFAPDERYQTAAELETVLDRFLSGLVGDRRRPSRRSDSEYRRFTRRVTIITAVSSTVIAALVAGYFLFRGNSKSVKPPGAVAVAGASTVDENILNRLADEPNKIGVIADSIRESIATASEDLNLVAEEKNSLVAEVDHLLNEFESLTLDPNRVDELLVNYKESSLPNATRALRLISLINRSALSEKEKVQSRVAVRKFAVAVAKGAISSGHADQRVNWLTNNKTVTAEELKTLKVGEARIRGWVKWIENDLVHLSAEQTDESTVTNEIKQLFERSGRSQEELRAVLTQENLEAAGIDLEQLRSLQ